MAVDGVDMAQDGLLSVTRTGRVKSRIHGVWIVARPLCFEKFLAPLGEKWQPTEIEARLSGRRGDEERVCQARDPRLKTEGDRRSLKMNLATSAESTWGGVGGKENDDGRMEVRKFDRLDLRTV